MASSSTFSRRTFALRDPDCHPLGSRDQVFMQELCRRRRCDLQMGLLVVKTHVSDRWEQDQLLVCRGDLVVDVDLQIPEGLVIVLGHYHHHGRSEYPASVRIDRVLHQQLDGFQGGPMLMGWRFTLLDLVEDRIDVRKRPGRELVLGILGRHGNVATFAGCVSQLPVVLNGLEEPWKQSLAVDTTHILETVDYRYIRNHALDTRVDGRQDQSVAAAVRDAPDAYAGWIQIWLLGSETDRVSVVLDLHPGVQMLTRRAVTGPEVSVVEQQGRDPLLQEELGVVRHHDLFDVTPATCHDDNWIRTTTGVGRCQPAPNCRALAFERDISFHRDLLFTLPRKRLISTRCGRRRSSWVRCPVLRIARSRASGGCRRVA